MPQIQDNSDSVIDKEPSDLKEESKKSDENVSAKGLTPGKVIITAEMFNSKQKQKILSKSKKDSSAAGEESNQKTFYSKKRNTT